ncbi:MAG: hypothetical protein GX609_03160 [Actinomycetales bacterium]|nr:hypothetical protein [Actinomycetales bacterium]
MSSLIGRGYGAARAGAPGGEDDVFVAPTPVAALGWLNRGVAAARTGGAAVATTALALAARWTPVTRLLLGMRVRRRAGEPAQSSRR